MKAKQRNCDGLPELSGQPLVLFSARDLTREGGFAHLAWHGRPAVKVGSACRAAFYLPEILSRWGAGPGLNRMLSQAVSHALIVDGRLGPLALQPGLSVSAESFTRQD